MRLLCMTVIALVLIGVSLLGDVRPDLIDKSDRTSWDVICAVWVIATAFSLFRDDES